MNRYTNVEVSAYNPMTTQEIWAPAAAMRQQHNAADEKLQTQIAELDKVNPLDVHYDKAQKIKSDLLKQIEGQAESLSREGFNGNTTSGVFKTNRQLREQFSPTGELGQINAAKTSYDTEKTNYLKSAVDDSKIGMKQALINWDKYAKSKYTGYSEDGKKIINIDAMGAPAYQDHDKQLAQMHSLLGNTKTSARNSGKELVEIGGMYALKAQNGSITTNKNIDQLNEMKKAYYNIWHNPKGMGYQWADQAGIDHETLLNQDNGTFNSMIVNEVDDRRGESYDFLPGQSLSNGPSTPPSSIYNPSSQISLQDKIQDINFNRIGSLTFGNPVSGSPSLMGTGGSGSNDKASHRNTYKDVLTSPIHQQLYRKAYEKLVANNRIPKGQDINDTNSAKIISIYMKKYAKVPTVGNDIILPDSATNSQQFLGEFDKKTGSERDAAAQSNLENGFRSIVDPVSGMELTPEEFRQKGYKVSYIGYDSHLSYNGYNFNGDNKNKQSILTHQVSVKDAEGNSLGQAPMTRTRQEMSTPEYKRSYQIGHIYRNAVERFGDWVIPTAVKGMKIKFKENGLFDINFNGNNYEDVSGPEYEMMMSDAMNQKEK